MVQKWRQSTIFPKNPFLFKFFLIRLKAVVTNLLIISYQTSEDFCAKIRRVLINYMFFGQQKKFLNSSNGQLNCTSDNRGEKVLQKLEKFLLNFSQKNAQKFFLKKFSSKICNFYPKIFPDRKSAVLGTRLKIWKSLKIKCWKSEKVTLNIFFRKVILVKMFLRVRRGLFWRTCRIFLAKVQKRFAHISRITYQNQFSQKK